MIIDWFLSKIAEMRPKTCKHKWRPALKDYLGKPCRHCSICDTTEEITEAEFYAQFGRIPRKWEW